MRYNQTNFFLASILFSMIFRIKIFVNYPNPSATQISLLPDFLRYSNFLASQIFSSTQISQLPEFLQLSVDFIETAFSYMY